MLECGDIHATIRWFYFESQFTQRGRLVDVNLILGHVGEATQDFLHGGWINIHPAHDDHVVHATENAADESQAAPSTLALRSSRVALHRVSGAIAQQRRAGAGERSEISSPLGAGLPVPGINNFSKVTRLDDVQHAGSRRTFMRDRADLRHAVMIEDAGAGPERFELGPRAGMLPPGSPATMRF